MKRRHINILLGSAMLAAGMCGCKESTAKKYSSAQELINKGQYSEAVKKLREISSYEDSSQLLLYASANAAAVEGSFSEAITTLQSLGNYKDSQNLIVYYMAKQAEEQENIYDIQYVASLYESIPLFRDSKEQEEAYLSGWYQTAVEDAEQENYADAYPIFDNLGTYSDSDKMIDYYEARRQEAEGDYPSLLKAKRVYDTMPEVADCAERSSKILEALQVAYKDAQDKMKKGEYEEALKGFESLGSYEDSLDLADQLEKEIENQKIYKSAEESLSKNNYADAIKKFGTLGSYADAPQRKEAIQEARYEAAEKMMKDEDFSGAIDEFEMLGSYKDCKQKLNIAKEEKKKKNTYQNAEVLYKNAHYEDAIQQFSKLGDYKDAAKRMEEIQNERYKAAEDMVENGDFEGAIAEFKMLGSYSDAEQKVDKVTKEFVNETAYEEAEKLLAEKDYVGAIDTFEKLNDYKDAAKRKEEIQAQRYEEAKNFLKAEEFEKAIEIFKELKNYKDSADQATSAIALEYQQAEQLYLNGEYEKSVDLFNNLAERNYLDSEKYSKYVEADYVGENGDYNTAAQMMLTLGDFRDAKKLRFYYSAKKRIELMQVSDIKSVVNALKLIVPIRDSEEVLEQYQKVWYDKAVVMGDSGEFDDAIEILEALKAYEDSSDLVTYYKARRYEFKDTNDDRMQAAAMYEKIPEVKDSAERKDTIINAQDEIYARAEEQLDSEEFLDAKKTFQSLGNYKDAKSRVKDTENARKAKIEQLCANQKYAEALHFQHLQAGDIIKFGEYEQDNNQQDGKEAIDWIVLDVQDDKALLLSQVCLEARCFWENQGPSSSSKYYQKPAGVIREWLNGEFKDAMFSNNEEKCICEANLIYDDSLNNDVTDEVFLLSAEEVEKYLKDNYQASVTLYACSVYDEKTMNSSTSISSDLGWWTRTVTGQTIAMISGDMIDTVCYVDEEGYGVSDGRALRMIRPAMWIDLAKCEEIYQHSLDAGELDNLPEVEISSSQEVESNSESTENAEQNAGAKVDTSPSTDAGIVPDAGMQDGTGDSTNSTGNAVAIINENIRNQADYLCIDQDEATGRIQLYFYLCPSGQEYNSYTPENEYLICGNYASAKTLVDGYLAGDMSMLPGYGDKKTIVWNSPYGLCAYSRSKSDYQNGVNDSYILNEDQIYQLLNTMGVPIEMVPSSQKQE